MAKNHKIFVGHVEFRFTNANLESMVSRLVEKQLQRNQNRVEEYINVIRTTQRKVKTLETKLAAIQLLKSRK